MRIHTESRIRHPQEKVYLAYRDRLPEMARYIPDVREIVTEKREEVPGGVKIHNVWIADREVPTWARAFLKPEMLRWDDYAEWDDAEHLVRWTIKLRVFTDNVRCSGTNAFRKIDEGTTAVVLEGDLDIDLKSIPGVPKFLASTLKPQIEKFIVSLITPNLERTNQSLQQFLDERG